MHKNTHKILHAAQRKPKKQEENNLAVDSRITFSKKRYFEG